MEDREYGMAAAKQQMGGSILGAQSIKPDRALDQLAVAADRIGRCAALTNEILVRFYGPSPENQVAEDFVPGHGGNISRLFSNLDQLEGNIAQLAKIG